MTTPLAPSSGTLVLDASVASDWLEQAYFNLKSHWLLCARAALFVLLMRVIADNLEAGTILFLSYITDSLIFAAAVQAFRNKSGLWQGMRSLSGRKKAIMLTSLWGLSSAAMGEASYLIAEPVARATVILTGMPWLGSIYGLLILIFGTYLAMLLLTGGVLAGLDAMEADGSFKASGTWGLLSAWRMRKPLAATFVAFLGITVSCFLATGLVLKQIFPADWDSYAVLSTVAIGATLFLAVSTFIALLPVILHEARRTEGDAYDISDEREADDAIVQFLKLAGGLLKGSGWILLAVSFLISASTALFLGGIALLQWGFTCRRVASFWHTETSKWKRYTPFVMACLFTLLLLWLSN